jgi:hypothetical protein
MIDFQSVSLNIFIIKPGRKKGVSTSYVITLPYSNYSLFYDKSRIYLNNDIIMLAILDKPFRIDKDN